jgi:hypothetical protein
MTEEGAGRLLDRVEIIDSSPGGPDNHPDTEALELSVTPRDVWVIGVVLALIAVILGNVDRQPKQTVRAVPSTIGTGELSRPSENKRFAPDEVATVVATGSIRRPALPVDRDPSYVGRPGSDEPVRSFLVDKTLLYVNDHGRPTIVDMTTGDQREVLIADGRSQGMFELEFGQIVTSDDERSGLPPSVGRSIGVIGVTAGLEVENVDESSIILCIDGASCPAGSASSTSLANSLDMATQLDSSSGAEVAIAEFLRVSTWTTDHRWTIFSFDLEDPQHVLRIPTPLPNTVIWLVSQRR